MAVTASQVLELVTALETSVTELQTAVNRLVTRREVNTLLALKQRDIESLTDSLASLQSQLEALQAAVVDTSALEVDLQDLAADLATVETSLTSLTATVNNLVIPSVLDDITDVTLTTTTSGQVLTFNGSEWVNQNPITDHGLLTGLADDDHSQYLLANGTRAITGTISTSGIAANGQIYSDLTTITPAGTSATIDWNTGNSQEIDLSLASGNVTVTLSNGAEGAAYQVLVTQGGNSRNITWSPTPKWPDATAPTITTTSGIHDLVFFTYLRGSYWGSFLQNLS